MSHTLGNKEAIVNNSKFYPLLGDGDFKDPAKGQAAIQAFVAGDLSQVTGGTAQRYLAEKLAQGRFTVPSGADLGLDAGDVRKPVSVKLYVTTTRHASENTNDFISRSVPVVAELSVDAADTASEVADKLREAYESYEKNIVVGEGLPFTWNAGSATMILTAKENHFFFKENVTFSQPYEANPLVTAITTASPVSEDGIVTGTTITWAGSVAADDIRIGDVITDSTGLSAKVVSITSNTVLVVDTAGLATGAMTTESYNYEPISGKYLEENVKMGTWDNTDPYASNAGESPFITGAYTELTFKLPGSTGGWKAHENLGASHNPGGKTGETEQQFTLYFLEGSDNFAADSDLSILIDKLKLSGQFTAYKADGTIAADGNAFVA